MTNEELRQLAETWNPRAGARVRHGVTVGQLRELLAGYPDELVVVVAEDPEGNEFDLLSSRMGVSWYVADGDCAGEIFDLTPGEEDDPFVPGPGDVPALVIGP